MKYITINPIKQGVANGTDIVLKETATTRLIFKPMIVDNGSNKKACVRGTFIHQKKLGSQSWEEQNNLDLRSLKSAEWTKMEIKSEELLTLLENILPYYDIYENHGIGDFPKKYFQVDSQTDLIEKLLNDCNTLEILLENENIDLIADTLKWVSANDDLEAVLDKLRTLDVKEIGKSTLC